MRSFESFQSQVVIGNQFPADLDGETHVLLYDQALVDHEREDPYVKDFIESFPHRLGVKGGEPLKSFKEFPKNLESLLKVWPQPVRRSQSLVILGGGSLGDFGGFVASILKRGIKLIHIPSTWLAAMDSAHGGKNALNLNGIKNQIGTFHPAEKVFIIKDLLEATPLDLKEQSYGELIKMALVGESQFFKEIMVEKRAARDFIWRFLKFCIEDKYSVILQDPFETKEIRQVLNFGHTFGHALESHFSWSHGDSVLQGIFFSLEWSRYRGELSQSLCEQICEVISKKFSRVPAHQLKWYRRPGRKAMAKLLLADKKMDSEGQVLFVFLKSIGKPALTPVRIEDLLSEAERQHWVK